MKTSFLTSPEDIAIQMGSAIRTQSQAGQRSKAGLMMCMALVFCVMLFGFMGVQIWTAIVGGKYVDSSTEECKKGGQFLVSYVAIGLGVGVLCGLCRPFLVQAGGGADPDENSLSFELNLK